LQESFPVRAHAEKAQKLAQIAWIDIMWQGDLTETGASTVMRPETRRGFQQPRLVR